MTGTDKPYFPDATAVADSVFNLAGYGPAGPIDREAYGFEPGDQSISVYVAGESDEAFYVTGVYFEGDGAGGEAGTPSIVVEVSRGDDPEDALEYVYSYEGPRAARRIEDSRALKKAGEIRRDLSRDLDGVLSGLAEVIEKGQSDRFLSAGGAERIASLRSLAREVSKFIEGE